MEETDGKDVIISVFYCGLNVFGVSSVGEKYHMAGCSSSFLTWTKSYIDI